MVVFLNHSVHVASTAVASKKLR